MNEETSCLVLVKNEEYYLPYVLAQTEGHFPSYVIYDVGSTDRTREIIKHFVEKMDGKAEFYIRYMDHVGPTVQGAFRNSMILEGNCPLYYLLDGDELYTPQSLENIKVASDTLLKANRQNAHKKYGVVRRVELSEDLTQQYVERRGHHRLYTSDAWWTGTHPGERAFYKQNEKSEVELTDITCWHFHNTLRSPKEEEALKRLQRKNQRSYHPGNEMAPLNLLEELPLLQSHIEDFTVSPALAKLQELYDAS